jgi:hypothetical protein
MADWFKFYENDLDETRLQYAISKLPEVVSVWVGLLSECCRHKGSKVSWGKDEIELFGFSRRLNISIPKVNEAVNILREIRYIAIEENHISVIKWDKKQSEYCQKLTKQQNQSGCQNPNSKKTPDSIPTVSRQCPDSVGQEERRGEENIHTHTAEAFPEVSVPSLDEVLTEAEMHGVKKESAESFFNHHQGNALWINQHHRLIDWRHKLKAWGERDRQTGGKSNANNGKNGQQRINRNIGTANEGDASEYANLRRVNGRVVKA